MPTQEIEIRAAEAAGGRDVISAAGAENYSPDKTGGAGPAYQADDAGQKKEGSRRAHVEREEGAHSEQEIEPREDEKKFGRSHERFVDPAAVVAGDYADEGAD